MNIKSWNIVKKSKKRVKVKIKRNNFFVNSNGPQKKQQKYETQSGEYVLVFTTIVWILWILWWVWPSLL